ncbi:MAG: hypothetical protein WC378_15280 [Opitutaceae bacterium]
MHLRTRLIPVVTVCLLCLFFGCSRKSEPPQKQATPGPVAQAPAVAKENTQLVKAMAFHKAFLEDLFMIGGVRNLDFYRRRVEFAEKKHGETIVLLKESQDPKAQKFLVDLAFLLLRYADSGRKVISTGEQIQKSNKAIEEGRATLGRIKDPSKKLLASMMVDSIARGLGVFYDAQARNTGELDKIVRELKELK